MIGLIKKAARNTLLHKAVRSYRARKNLMTWTAFDQQALEFYSQFLSKGRLCFDVGANIGNRTKIFLRLWSRVVAVEPQTECRKILNRAFVNDQRLIIVDKALGESDGTAEMMISDSSTISSLSAAWVDAVNSSERFSGHSWDKKVSVSLTTLDDLIRDFGIPDFIKIDVEGFEFQVVSGLSQSVKVISLEFTPEFMDATFRCIDHCSQLGDIDLNYSLGESMQLGLEKWATPKEMTGILSQFKGDNKLFGDVYVHFTESEGKPHLTEQK